jgi:hypothetical protein
VVSSVPPGKYRDNTSIRPRPFPSKSFAIIKSRRMRWAEHVARMGRRGLCTGFRWENQKERDNLEDQDVGGGIILKWNLKRWKYGLD